MRALCVLLVLLGLQAFQVTSASTSDKGPGGVGEGPLIDGDPDTDLPVDDREHGIDPDEEENGRKRNGGEVRSARKKRFVSITPDDYWLNGIVPYVFLDTITEDHRISALAAMKFISDNTCIRFVPWNDTTRASYGLDNDGHINLDTQPGKGCTAATGNSKDPSGQLVKCCDRVTCTHELGHVLGWGHEQQSIERDGWVRINWQNITSDMRPWYRKRSGEDRLFYGYDISSTMHYLAKYGPNLPTAITVLFPELPIERAYFYYFREIALTYQCHERNCSHFSMTCHNEGFVTMVNGQCQCYCPDGLDPATGCQTILKQISAPAEFPGGQYAMLAPKEGCPADGQFQTGSLVHFHYKANSYNPFLLQGSMSGNRAEQHFCVRDSPANEIIWPVGDYCILRSGGLCPEGFGSGYVQYDNLPPTSTEYTQTSGVLPDGSFTDDVRFEFCCRNDGYPDAPLDLPNTEPLVLFRHTKDCHPIAGMSATDSYVWVKHSEAETGTDASPDNRPKYFHYGSGSVYVGYCYYHPVNQNCGEVIDLDANQRSVTLTSPGYPASYANDLDCHWLIRGPENSTFVFNIDDLDIEQKSNGDCIDELQVNHAKIGHKPLSYCGTERRASIRSITNLMSVRLMTSYSGQKRGFSATVTVHLAEDHCYDQSDKGASYRGTVNFTRDNEPCLPWTEVSHCYHHAFKENDLSDGLDANYCRNPGDGLRPWCYVQAENCVRNYCDVCQLERPYDAFDDCAALQAEGLCSDEYLARKGCTKTCQQDLPAPNLIKFAEISCPHPPTPFDAINVSPVKTSYSVGDTITYQCNSSSEHVTSTCLTDGTWSPVGYVCGGCPSGWYVYNKVCHRRFVDEVKTFSEAKAVCASHGATLATAKSMEDVEFLFDLGDKDGDYIWLGLSKNSGGQWMWEDGTALSWSNWKSGNPSSGGCALMDSNKEWKSVSCSYDYIYVCSMQPSGRQACVDRREDCGDILRETPTLCQDQPDFAWLMCANTCGACTPTDPVASVAPSPSCPSDWTEYKNACYKFHDSWKTYADAGAACSAYGEGVTLTTAKDEGEFNFTKSIIVPLGESYWLGLDDLNQEGVFTWADGSPVIYSAWSRRRRQSQPDNKDTVNGVTTEADCTQVALNGLWKDISCDKKRRFICKSVLAGSSTNECVVPALPANANADPSIGSSLSRGQYVTYTCQDGYVPVSGDVRRACTENGVLTGTDLVCRAESEATTESSTVRLMDRQHVGDASYSYTGTAEHLRITRNGHVTAWRFYSNRAGQVAFQVFRPRPDLGSNSFELIGQNVVTTRENRVQTVAVDTADRIQVQDGDVLGIYCGQTVGGVPFENCQESQTQEGLSVMRSTVATSDPSTLTPGTVMEFDNSPTCRIFSFRAVIEP